jgi:leader peptidase (prepilin peptidase)/N-methyltransferase
VGVNPMFIINLIFIALLGACLGSFANVLIYRIPENKSIYSPGSYCPCCKHPIRWYDNIPVLSFILLSGKCRHCHKKISLRYLLVELFTTLAIVFFWLKFKYSILFAGYAILALCFIVISVIDIKHNIIPDILTVPLILFGLIFSPFNRYLGIKAAIPARIVGSMLGIACGIIVFYMICILGRKIFRKEALGGGDIKLVGAIGAFLGCRGLLLSIFLGSLLGTIIALISIYVTKKTSWGSYLPYGPFLCLGAIIYLFVPGIF